MKLIIKSLFLVLAIVGTTSDTLSQELRTDFFTPVARSRNSLVPSQAQKLDRLENNTSVTQVTLVTIGDLKDYQQQGDFDFKLPGESQVIAARASKVETNSQGDFTWDGTVSEGQGSIILMSKGGAMFGHFAIDDRKLELWPLGDGLYALCELDFSKSVGVECATNDVPETQAIEKDNSSENDNARFLNCSQHVRILVLFTPAAANEVADINLTATLAVQQINTAFLNSGVLGDGFVRVGMAGPIELDFTETSNITTDVATLVGHQDVPALKAANGADLIVLLTSTNYGPTLGVAADYGPNESTAYAIVTASAATGNYTLAHEVGHLFGGRHQQCSVWNNLGCDDTAGAAHGFGFNYGFLGLTKRSTVMHQLRTNYTRILNYSNPSISYDGQSTGTSNNNIASHMLAQASTVAAFEPFIGTLEASVVVQAHVPSFQQYTCEAVAICGVAPHTYEWRIGVDGFNYGDVVSTDLFLENTPPQCISQFVWLRIFSSDSQQGDFFFTLSHFNNECEESRRRAPQIEQIVEAETNPELVVFPNPADDLINIRYYVAESTSTGIVISNLQGQSIFSRDFDFKESGWHTLNVPSSTLPNGVYTLTIKNGPVVEMRRVLIGR